jgi:hypothetical protein
MLQKKVGRPNPGFKFDSRRAPDTPGAVRTAKEKTPLPTREKTAAAAPADADADAE